MLADEPTGALDSRNGQEIIRLLKESNKKYRQTLLLVTHDENIALQADRIITIGDGKVIQDAKIRKPWPAVKKTPFGKRMERTEGQVMEL